MDEIKNTFTEFNSINVNEHVEEKQGLKYLSWIWAWSEVAKRYPDANYEIVKFNGIPYVYDPQTGYMVYTKVTIGGVTREMWLPVMDSNNRAMKAEEYTVETKYKTITIAPATMFDINKTIMRCLTKNLAMFGVGSYLYAGEDLPEEESVKKESTKKPLDTPKTIPAAVPKVEPVKEKLTPETTGVAVERLPLTQLKNEIGAMVKASKEKTGSMEEYAHIVEYAAHPGFRVNVATEAEYSEVLSIYNELKKIGYQA